MTNNRRLRMIKMTLTAYRDEFISLGEALEIVTLYLGFRNVYKSRRKLVA